MKGEITYQQWQKTPYAKSTAQNPVQSLTALLQKYGCDTIQMTQGPDVQGRMAFATRFMMDGKCYTVLVHTLKCAKAPPEALLRQVQRAVFFRLKALLEQVNVFATAEELLLPYLETAGGAPLHVAIQGKLQHLVSEGIPAVGLEWQPPDEETPSETT